MSNIKTEIIEQLKQDLEYKSDAYCQWLMGVSIPGKSNSEESVTVRVVVMTNESPFVDGMDIDFTVGTIIDPEYYKFSPEFMGGTVKDSLIWLQSHGEIILEQLENPFENIQKEKHVGDES